MTGIVGSHFYRNTNADVERLFIEKQFCPFLPTGLGNFFENLLILFIAESNVQHLQKGDLDGLKKLKTLDLSRNPIDYLTADVFEGQESLTRVVFWGCHLRFIDPASLNPLVNLKEAIFDENVCVDSRCEKKTCMDDMKNIFTELCRDDENISCFKRRNNTIRINDLDFTEENATAIISISIVFLIFQGGILLKLSRKKSPRAQGNLEFTNLHVGVNEEE